jgi:hypothetical protein
MNYLDQDIGYQRSKQIRRDKKRSEKRAEVMAVAFSILMLLYVGVHMYWSTYAK